MAFLFFKTASRGRERKILAGPHPNNPPLFLPGGGEGWGRESPGEGWRRFLSHANPSSGDSSVLPEQGGKRGGGGGKSRKQRPHVQGANAFDGLAPPPLYLLICHTLVQTSPEES